jgi:hypothetical protein
MGMLEKISRNRVKGFLKASGRTIVNGEGEDILLTGWGLGNWLLCEGYMWCSNDDPNFDRPRIIEKVIRDLAGSVYAETFWKKFRANYITKDDIQRMAELGYNSVRIPFNWRILMEDEPDEIIFKEDGLALLDQCIAWCEEYGIYAFLDLHGAPGGQTGANIDDSQDNLPRLLMDKDYWDKGIALWEHLAARYAEKWIVGGYDILNEPIRPPREGYVDCDYLVPKLKIFYEEAVAAIRKFDKKHLLSIEGHHWSTNAAVFTNKYDDNMVIHFHRYHCIPDISAYSEFLDLSKRLDLPLWLGETGENNNRWYAAMYPQALSLGIGYNIWPWKKMDCTNSPYSVHKPEHWDILMGYVRGGLKPDKKQVIAILDRYLENIILKNCRENAAVIDAVYRRPACVIRAAEHAPPGEKCELELNAGESVSYAVYMTEDGDALQLAFHASGKSHVIICQNGISNGEFDYVPGKSVPVLPLRASNESIVNITVQSGKIYLESLFFRRPFRDEKSGGLQRIPGKIMCAYYDRGGEGAAYHDSDAVNHGSGELNPLDGSYLHGFRVHEGVDTSYVKYRDDIDNSPYNMVLPEKDMLYVGWTVPGEWMSYTVSVQAAGKYGVELLYTSHSGGKISLDIDGTSVCCDIGSTYSADDPIEWRQWHHWNKQPVGEFVLTEGLHVITLTTLEQGNMNYGCLEFRKIVQL